MRLLISAIWIFALVSSAILGADGDWESSAKIPVPDGAKVSIAFDRQEYLLGENALIHFVLENNGTTPFTVFFGGDSDGGRPVRFKVSATDENTLSAEDPEPNSVRRGGQEQEVNLKPGEKFSLSLALSRFCQFATPGRYTVHVTHDFGWKEGERKRPMGEAVVVFRLPSPEEAQQLIGKMEAQSKSSYRPMERHSPDFVDFTCVKDSVYLNLFLKRVRDGNLDAMQSIGNIATINATAALIALAGDADPKLSLSAGQILLQRLPYQPLPGEYVFPEREKRWKLFEKKAWEHAFATQVCALALKFLAKNDPAEVVCGANMLNCIGGSAEAPETIAALDRALPNALNPRRTSNENTLDLPQPVRELIRAMRAIHRRGFELGEGLQGNARILLYFDWLAGKPAPRPERWLDSAKAFGDSNCYPLSETILRSIPEPVPENCYPLIHRGLEHRDCGVMRVASDLAGKTGERSFVKPLLEIIASEHEDWLLRSASDAAHKLGAGYELYEIWVNRMAEDGMFELALDSLQRLIDKRPGSYGGSSPSRSGKMEMCKLWKQFLADHAVDIRNGKLFKIGDAELKPELFGQARQYTLPGGKVWPETPKVAAELAGRWKPIPVPAPAVAEFNRLHPPKPNSEIDQAFRRFQNKLPLPETMSEGNGPAFNCGHHGGVCYTLLSSLAEKLPVQRDEDLADLVPWCNHPDLCLRYIALSRLANINGYEKERNGLSIPGMLDVEHWMFYENMLKTKEYLDKKHVAYEPTLFADTIVDVKESDFTHVASGRWEEEFDHKNFQEVVTIEDNTIRVTRIFTGDDPHWPWKEHTVATGIKDVHLNEKSQFTITGSWDLESNSSGFQGKRIEPSQYTYTLWPIGKDVLWFKRGEQGSWLKLRKSNPKK